VTRIQAQLGLRSPTLFRIASNNDHSRAPDGQTACYLFAYSIRAAGNQGDATCQAVALHARPSQARELARNN
jgi:hypothetical protein